MILYQKQDLIFDNLSFIFICFLKQWKPFITIQRKSLYRRCNIILSHCLLLQLFLEYDLDSFKCKISCCFHHHFLMYMRNSTLITNSFWYGNSWPVIQRNVVFCQYDMEAIASSGNKTMIIDTNLSWFLAFRVICPFQRGDNSKAINVPYFSVEATGKVPYRNLNYMIDRKIAKALTFLNVYTLKVSRST